MTQVSSAVVILLLCALIGVTQSHICLMDPPQRGGFNVSDPGDISCFQPTGPCGTVPAGAPQVVLGGTGYAVRLQQNLNHYNPGWPGFIDVAWAMGTNPTSADFITLATIPDYWPHLQAQQTNFSIPVTLPNINCDRCTLRVRYNPHKPTEPVFHNCADIKIVTPVKQPKGRLFGWAQANNQDSFFVEISLDGSLKKLSGPLPIRLDSNKQGAPLDTPFTGFANGLIAVDKRKQQLYMIGYNVTNTLDDNTQPKPSTWVHFDLSQNQFIGASPIVSSTPNSQWVAVVTNNGGTTYPALAVELVRVIGSGYKFQVRQVNYYGGVSAPIGNFPFDNTFVNFFWSEFDENKQILYILSGDENSLFDLNVRLFSLNIVTGQVSAVNVDNSKYTITSIHVDSATGNLYTLSPGLYPQTKPGQWTVVSINPTTGGVTPMGARGLLESYADWYGGGVYGGNSILSSSYILYQFQKPYSGATVLSMIDIAASKTTYSTTLNTGVNNPLTLQSVTFLPPPQ